MRFKEFYLLENKSNEIFNRIFEKHYKRGFFGELCKEDIKPQQEEWFEDLLQLIRERNEEELILTLSNKEYKLSREYFTEITGINIKYETKANVITLIHEYIEDAKRGLKNVQQGPEA